jgi:hypothetical protein
MGPKPIVGKIMRLIGMVAAGLCLLRVLSVSAADDIEVYPSMEKTNRTAEADADGDNTERAEIRISRPDEAASRIADDQGYDIVPGAEKWAMPPQRRQDELIVPRKSGRAIAAEAPLPASPVDVRPGVAQSQHADLTAEVMEPRPFTANDARDRAAEHHPETIVASRAKGSPSYGIKSDPPLQTSIQDPLPISSSRGGVQEISLIVSDYGYFPSKIFVTQGVPVKIYMTTPSKTTLCFMLDTWNLKKGINPGKVEEVTFTPDQAGDYRFYCPVKSIEGKLTVRESVTSAPSARGLASREAQDEDDKLAVKPTRANEPKNANQLRALIDE